MTISEDRLLAYVDGLLSEEEVREIERELAVDADARTVVEALRASALPYREAVNDLIPVPDLSKLETEIRRAHTRPTARIYRFAPIAAALLLFFGAGLLAGHYVLPPPQEALEAKYKEELEAVFGVVFNGLFTITNMPIKRFADQLYKQGKLAEYMQLLVDNFNDDTVPSTMCRSLVSVAHDGSLYDCDFNLALALPLQAVVPAQHLAGCNHRAAFAGWRRRLRRCSQLGAARPGRRAERRPFHGSRW